MDYLVNGVSTASSVTDLATLLTTNNDIAMRLAGVPARFATSETGKAVMAASSAAALRAILYPSTPVSLADATGWSAATAAGTTSTINVVPNRAVLTVAAATATYTLAAVARTALPALGRYSYQARIAAWTGIAATGTEQMLVRLTDASGGTYDLWLYGSDRASLVVPEGEPATVPVASVSVPGLFSGQGWIRVTPAGTVVLFECGVGVEGADPTAWTAVGSRATATSLLHPYTSLSVQIRRTSPQATDLVAEIASVSYRNLDP